MEFEKDILASERMEYEQRAGDESAFFGAYPFDGHDNLTHEEIAVLRTNLGALAAELWEMPSATWEELAAEGGYEKYLKQVEEICPVHTLEKKYGDTIEEGERRIEAYAEESGLDLMYVSGLTGIRQDKDGTWEVLLSETTGKDWTHQPHGGKRIEGEGAVAAMIREFGEEAGWDAAMALLKAFKSGDAFYAGYYASRMGEVLGEDNKGANTLLAIQCFIIDGKVLEGLRLQPDSDSKTAEWLRVDQLPEGIVFTTQSDYWMRAYFGATFPRSKYTHPRIDEGYDGTLLTT